MKFYTFISLILLFGTSVFTTEETQFCNGFDKDPCLTENEGCLYRQGDVCDGVTSSTWYRVRSPIPNDCKEKTSCGSLYPIWLVGDEPRKDGEIKVGEVCKAGHSSCCEGRYKIKMKKCKDYIAYCLSTVCSQRYCFGNKACVMAKSTNYTILKEQGKPIDTKFKLLEAMKTRTSVSTMKTIVEGSTTWTDPHAKTEIQTTIATATFLFAVATFLVLVFICKRCRNESRDQECENGNKKWKRKQFKRFK